MSHAAVGVASHEAEHGPSVLGIGEHLVGQQAGAAELIHEDERIHGVGDGQRFTSLGGEEPTSVQSPLYQADHPLDALGALEGKGHGQGELKGSSGGGLALGQAA